MSSPAAIDDNLQFARLYQITKIVGPLAHRYEQLIYALATKLTIDRPEDGICRYQGGCWDLLEIPPGENQPRSSYWFRLNTPPDQRWFYSNDMNMSSAVLDSDMLSMIVNLMVSSHLCGAMFEAALRCESDDALYRRYSTWNEAWHDIRHAQLAYFLDRLKDQPEQLALLLSCID